MISLNYRDSRPIYEQIKDGLKKLIVTGGLAADERLPSVRALATPGFWCAPPPLPVPGTASTSSL